MKLHGQRGYAMVALLVGLSIASLLMTATMPVWSQMAKREKEAELIFRLGQYARAIRLFSRRAGPGVLPPSIDVLVQQKHLRKKYKDPITGDDFQVVSQLTQTAITAPGSGRGGPPPSSTQPGRGSAATNPGGTSPFGGNNGNTPGGVAGVVSTSKEESLRVVQGRTHYNEWVSTAFASTSIPGGATGAGGASAAPGVVPAQGAGRGGTGAPGGAGRGAPTTGPGGQGAPGGPSGPRTVPPSPQPFGGQRR
jgi:type II secretory pathway pseudopilin PulG